MNSQIITNESFFVPLLIFVFGAILTLNGLIRKPKNKKAKLHKSNMLWIGFLLMPFAIFAQLGNMEGNKNKNYIFHSDWEYFAVGIIEILITLWLLKSLLKSFFNKW